MENKLSDIISESCGIRCNLETIDGQMTFFSHLIQDIERYKDGMSAMLKAGELEKQLNAIYMLLLYELRNIEEANEKIMKLSEKEEGDNNGK